MNDYKFYQAFSSNFLSGEYNQFIFSGNINDIFLFNQQYYNLNDYLVTRLSHSRMVIKFSLATGIDFVNREERDYFITTMAQNLPFYDTYDEKRSWVIKSIAQSRVSVIEGLKLMKEASVISRDANNKKVFEKPFAFLLEHAETLLPNNEISHMYETDRKNLAFIRDWLGDDFFIKSKDLIIFISQTVSEVHRSIILLPSISNIVIDYPEFDERKTFIANEIEKLKLITQITSERASDLTAGLNLNGIHHILMKSKYVEIPLTEEEILSKTEEVIKGTIGDYIKIINPDHSFNEILGATKIINELKRQVKIIKLNNPEIIPRGFLVSGRNGVGKTYVMEAFAGELGWLCVELKNLRQKYLGETDAVFERIKNVLESFKNVMVFIDEADTMFGGRGEEVHETEKRLTGNFIKMMGDPKNRGRIIWVFITSRPDLLLPDFIRRLEIKIGFFNPQGADRLIFLKDILRKIALDFDQLKNKEKKELLTAFADFSPAEFKLITTQLKAEKELLKNLSAADVIHFLSRFNLNIGRDKLREQDMLAREYSTFMDLLD